MNLIDKMRFKLKNLLGFEKLNPINAFDFEDYFEENNSKDNIELFKIAINNYPELKEVIWIAIYHCLNTYSNNNEFLTVLDVNYQIICDLIEGNDDNVEIPDYIKQNILDGEVLATFHNHFNGAIIPSSNDLKNTVLPFLHYMVITSQGNIGIIINDIKNFDDKIKNLFKQDWIFYLTFINWSFNNDMDKEIQLINNRNLNQFDKQKEEQILFDKYISENISRFGNEFNSRMKKYNVYFLYISIRE